MKSMLILASSVCLMLVVSCTENDALERPEPPQTKPQPIVVPDGFEVDSIYSPSTHKQGSWVALAEAPNNTFYASDQFGRLYKFEMPEVGETLDSTRVDSLDLNIGHAHGLIWAFNSLYVAVNLDWEREQYSYGSGIYRLHDSDQDGELDHVEMLLRLEGSGEHGPHSFILSPDGQRLFFIAGNHTLIPEELAAQSRLPNTWGEDNLLPPYLDARGHANDIEAPGGWVASFAPDGTDWDLVAAGFRNAFDFGFNADGELFVFDADMEWDIGMPWYRPIRVCHATSGAEFGWRTGTGKWPDYYPDNLPAVINLGQGSPTAVVMGKDLQFGPSFRDGLFAVDWSFGTIYYVDLQPHMSSYTGTKKEFLSGAPLPLTDVIAGSDGHMYFAVGGRRLESHLYRVRNTKLDSTEEANQDAAAAKLRSLRHSIEEQHVRPTSSGVALAMRNLDHEDRFIRYASRIALEHQPANRWSSQVLNTKNTTKLLEGGLALARVEHKPLQNKLIKRLLGLSFDQLSETEKIGMLRVLSLTFIRAGNPDVDLRNEIVASLQPHFPSPSDAVNRELANVLIHLLSPGATSVAVDLLEQHTKEGSSTEGLLSAEVTARSARYGEAIENVIKHTPPSEAIFYGVQLSHAKTGWTEETRTRYFQWYFDVMGAKGGHSFKAFMENARQKALENVPPDQRQKFDELSGVYSPGAEMANLPQPIGPGGVYNPGKVNEILRDHIDDNFVGNYQRAKRAYEAALCATCHRMNGEGGIIGPDLSQIDTRFRRGEIINAIVTPHDEISDQYAFTLFEFSDGSKKAGRIASEDDEKVIIMPNPYTSALKVEVPKSEIVERGLSPISPMPPGLLNRLNEEEIVDLMTFLMSGGDKKHELFTGKESSD